MVPPVDSADYTILIDKTYRTEQGSICLSETSFWDRVSPPVFVGNRLLWDSMDL
ncbi:hypothetical protein CsatA_001917 [Cannabis sativa]